MEQSLKQLTLSSGIYAISFGFDENDTLVPLEYGGMYPLRRNRAIEVIAALAEYVDSYSDEEINKARDYCESLEREDLNSSPVIPVDHSGFVYLIHGGDHNYKIGYSKNPEERCKQLSVGRVSRLELIHSFPADDAREAEQQLHEYYHGSRIIGEWFNLSLMDIAWIKSLKEYKEGQFEIHEEVTA